MSRKKNVYNQAKRGVKRYKKAKARKKGRAAIFAVVAMILAAVGVSQKNIGQLEQAVDKLVMDGQTDRRGAFLDEVVMGEVLGEVKEIAARGGIACGCGSAEYGVKVGFSAVDLVCARCGATLRLNAATPDDIDAVCAQYTLTIPGKKEQGL